MVLLDSDGKHTLAVDVREALDEGSNQWATERLGPVIVMGDVEESPVSTGSVYLKPHLTEFA